MTEIIKKLSKAYSNMVGRCYKENNPSYKNYGGRGIKVCDDWKNGTEIDGIKRSGRDLFIEWSFMNGYKLGLSIDRIDVNGDYCPSNCRWVTISFQDNNKRNCHYLTARGKTQTVSQWSKEVGLDTHTITNRLKRGFTEEEAVFTPNLSNAKKGIKR